MEGKCRVSGASFLRGGGGDAGTEPEFRRRSVPREYPIFFGGTVQNIAAQEFPAHGDAVLGKAENGRGCSRERKENLHDRQFLYRGSENSVSRTASDVADQ